MYFNVPQSRERMIFIGVREDIEREPTFPKAQSRPIAAAGAIEGIADDPTAFKVGEHTKIYQDMLKVPPGKSQPGHHSHIRLPVDRPSPALLADSGFGHYHYWHPIEHRVLTFNELKALASFPVAFQLTGNPGQRWARIGNSVPPLFMRAIAAHVQQTVLA